MSCSLHADIAKARRSSVSVNGVVIPHEAISRETQNHPAPTPLAADRRRKALVVRELLLQEARRRELTPGPAKDAQGRQETDDESLIRQLLETAAKIPDADRETCRRYYDRNRGRFRSPTMYEVAHFLFAAPRRDPTSFRGAVRKAESMIAILKEAPDRFEDLARGHSDCPSGADGGALGQITSGQTTPEFEAALETLKEGKITDRPVATRYGVHIIRLDRRIDGAELPFEMVEQEIAKYLRAAATDRPMRFTCACSPTRLKSPDCSSSLGDHSLQRRRLS
jgi:peptidyl-prolyl cis-trans isomerase C